MHKILQIQILAWALTFFASLASAQTLTQNVSNPDDVAIQSPFESALQSLQARRPNQVIEYADQVIKHFEDRYRPLQANELQFSSSGNPVLTLVYALEGARQKKNAKVYSGAWATSYFLKGFALVQLRRYDEGRQALEAAVSLDPKNAQYTSELANTLGVLNDYSKAYELFQIAEQNAKEFSAQERKTPHIARALRGQGFALIELKRLDEAQSRYVESLKLEPGNPTAAGQLRYIEQLRATGVTTVPQIFEPSVNAGVPANFEAAWNQAIAATNSMPVQNYMRAEIFDKFFAGAAHEKFRMQCATAIVPTPPAARVVFGVDAQGVVTNAWTDQQGFVADCLKEKVLGSKMAAPPAASPLLVCMKLDGLNTDKTIKTACGAVSLRQECERQGITESCKLYSR